VRQLEKMEAKTASLLTQSGALAEASLLKEEVPAAVLKEGTKVCVTGANGFLGLHFVQQLLERGCHVVAAVRSVSEDKVSALLKLKEAAPAKAELQIVGGCDIKTEGSFDAAVAECEACFHLASPCTIDPNVDKIKDVVEPATQGTLSVLRACTKAPKMRRVVVTSSTGAIMNLSTDKAWPSDFLYTEEHWNVTSGPVDGVFPPMSGHNAYAWSKTMAERAAWDFVATEKPAFSLTCFCPPFVVGPILQDVYHPFWLNESNMALYVLLIEFQKENSHLSTGFMDARDVAKIEIMGCEAPVAANQRYLCNGAETMTWMQFAGVLQEVFPDIKFPKTATAGTTVQPCLRLDCSKFQRDFVFEPIPLKKTLLDTMDSFKERGLMKWTCESFTAEIPATHQPEMYDLGQ